MRLKRFILNHDRGLITCLLVNLDGSDAGSFRTRICKVGVLPVDSTSCQWVEHLYIYC